MAFLFVGFFNVTTLDGSLPLHGLPIIESWQAQVVSSFQSMLRTILHQSEFFGGHLGTLETFCPLAPLNRVEVIVMKRYGWTCEGPGNWQRGEWSLGWYQDGGPTGWYLTGPARDRYLALHFVDAVIEANEILSGLPQATPKPPR